MAGKRVGYPQLILTSAGMLISMICGGKFFVWFLQNWSRLQNPSDPSAMLLEMWHAAKWPLAGMALFGVAWIWGAVTGLGLVAKAKARNPQRSA